MLHPLTIAGVGVLIVRQSDENVWGRPKFDKKNGGVRHIEFTFEPARQERWANVEEDDTFVDGESDGIGTSAGIAICGTNPARTPEGLRQALARASIGMGARVGYHIGYGRVVICLDYTEPTRISQEIVDTLASHLGM